MAHETDLPRRSLTESSVSWRLGGWHRSWPQACQVVAVWAMIQRRPARPPRAGIEAASSMRSGSKLCVQAPKRRWPVHLPAGQDRSPPPATRQKRSQAAREGHPDLLAPGAGPGPGSQDQGSRARQARGARMVSGPNGGAVVRPIPLRPAVRYRTGQRTVLTVHYMTPSRWHPAARQGPEAQGSCGVHHP